MAKRFTDTEKWKRAWFSDLNPTAKLVWIYICDNCDHCGVWPMNFRKLSFDLGTPVAQADFEEWFHDKFLLVEDDKYFFESFIRFQQRLPLNRKNNAHRPIIDFLEKHKIHNDFVENEGAPCQPLPSPSLAPREPLARGPGKGKGNVTVKVKVNSSSDLNSKTVAACAKTWLETLATMGIDRANIDANEQVQIGRSIQTHGSEYTDRVLYGARFEKGTEGWNPKDNPSISRVLFGKNKQGIPHHEKLSNLGISNSPKEWETASDAV